MLISHRKKFIYTKTAKTAGTSVESYFEKYCMPEGEWEFAHHRDQHVCNEGIIGARGPDAAGQEWFNHMPASDIRNKISSEIWDSYFKFCVIRNPFDMLVSWFYFQVHKGWIEMTSTGDVVNEFQTRMGQGIPVLGRDKYMIDGKICVDFLIRYEGLENGVQHVCQRLGVPFRPQELPGLKRGFRDQSIPLGSFYTPELERQVEEAYEFELSEFGYPHRPWM